MARPFFTTFPNKYYMKTFIGGRKEITFAILGLNIFLI